MRLTLNPERERKYEGMKKREKNIDKKMERYRCTLEFIKKSKTLHLRSCGDLRQTLNPQKRILHV